MFTLLKDYQQQFIEVALHCGALRFGEFILKSGRRSPYFFNAGHFSSAQALYQIGQCYATAIVAEPSFIDTTLLFGPAYKGIPLATCTALALYQHHQHHVNCAFNRKEAKAHGEGGQLMGAAIEGNVLIIDDVITAGTAVREVLAMLADSPAHVLGLMIGLNRQEQGMHGLSAIAELENLFKIKVSSIINADHLIDYLTQTNQHQHLEKMHAYLQQYGS